MNYDKLIKRHKISHRTLKALRECHKRKRVWAQLRDNNEDLFRTSDELNHKIEICEMTIIRLTKIYQKQNF